ncbi:MAG: hypothetical protein UT14_C0050G0005 [Candidatus Shapirobacteria bacterium GW2011_GWE1_38_92]|uniref:Uncharacterized protein n=1 Tax=Candidatus Shapirobacteria bacterium GW2011_GWE1_38_92 TaxID=1618489 RepID=A0A0G0NVG3_9BACT|nr:MAG: hypothetical protein UT14_C0050G0005 [Candidatus Shapirobacteria bacterium GW2011_GWE1_38_92]
MSEKFTPYFKTSAGESLARPSVVENFAKRQDLSPATSRPLGEEIQIRLNKD